MKKPNEPSAQPIAQQGLNAAHHQGMTTPTIAKPVPTTPWLSIEDLAEYVRSPKGTIYRWRYLGEGPPARGQAGKRPLYHRDDVDAWLVERAAA